MEAVSSLDAASQRAATAQSRAVSLELFPWRSRKTTQWSGGETTELFIAPPPAGRTGQNSGSGEAAVPPPCSFAARDFAIRISQARVELPETTFTQLEGVRRIFMLLYSLDDPQQHESVRSASPGAAESVFSLSIDRTGSGSADIPKTPVRPLSTQLQFSGTDLVRSHGRCVAFNVMLRPLLPSSINAQSERVAAYPRATVAVIWLGQGGPQHEDGRSEAPARKRQRTASSENEDGRFSLDTPGGFYGPASGGQTFFFYPRLPAPVAGESEPSWQPTLLLTFEVSEVSASSSPDSADPALPTTTQQVELHPGDSWLLSDVSDDDRRVGEGVDAPGEVSGHAGASTSGSSGAVRYRRLVGMPVLSWPAGPGSVAPSVVKVDFNLREGVDV